MLRTLVLSILTALVVIITPVTTVYAGDLLTDFGNLVEKNKVLIVRLKTTDMAEYISQETDDAQMLYVDLVDARKNVGELGDRLNEMRLRMLNETLKCLDADCFLDKANRVLDMTTMYMLLLEMQSVLIELTIVEHPVEKG